MHPVHKNVRIGLKFRLQTQNMSPFHMLRFFKSWPIFNFSIFFFQKGLGNEKLGYSFQIIFGFLKKPVHEFNEIILTIFEADLTKNGAIIEEKPVSVV